MIIRKELLNGKNGRSLLIGDGNSDLLASHAVDLFVGYGGVIKRQNVFENAPAYLHSLSLAPLLALAAGPAALRLLQGTTYQALSKKAFHLINNHAITFTDPHLENKFVRAVENLLFPTQSTPNNGTSIY